MTVSVAQSLPAGHTEPENGQTPAWLIPPLGQCAKLPHPRFTIYFLRANPRLSPRNRAGWDVSAFIQLRPNDPVRAPTQREAVLMEIGLNEDLSTDEIHELNGLLEASVESLLPLLPEIPPPVPMPSSDIAFPAIDALATADDATLAAWILFRDAQMYGRQAAALLETTTIEDANLPADAIRHLTSLCDTYLAVSRRLFGLSGTEACDAG